MSHQADMLIFTRNAFVSIVNHPQDDRFLVVRGRIPGDIESFFPEAEVFERPGADYRFQTSVPRDRVANRLATSIREIKYEAFEATVDDADRRQAYLAVWSAMYEEQSRRVTDETLATLPETEVKRTDLDAAAEA